VQDVPAPILFYLLHTPIPIGITPLFRGDFLCLQSVKKLIIPPWKKLDSRSPIRQLADYGAADMSQVSVERYLLKIIFVTLSIPEARNDVIFLLGS